MYIIILHSSRLSCAVSNAFRRYWRMTGFSFLVTALIVGLATVPGTAAIYTATLTTASGNWNNPTIWSSNPLFPDNDTPSVGDTWIANVGLSVTVNTPITIDDLNWSAGTIADSSSLDLVGSASTWSSTSYKEINGPAANLRNSGTITLTGAYVRSSASGSGLTNLNGGVFDITGDGIALINNYVGTFDNQSGAIFLKSGGSGTSTIQWALNNRGNVQAQVGTLKFVTGGGLYGGITTISPGATVEFNSGTFTLQNGGTVSGGGDLLVSNATLNLAAGGTFISGTHLVQTGGTLAGGGDASSNLVLSGNYDWSGGSLGGTGIVSIQGTNNVWSGTSFKEIGTAYSNVQNSGIITLTGTSVRSPAPAAG